MVFNADVNRFAWLINSATGNEPVIRRNVPASARNAEFKIACLKASFPNNSVKFLNPAKLRVRSLSLKEKPTTVANGFRKKIYNPTSPGIIKQKALIFCFRSRLLWPYRHVAVSFMKIPFHHNNILITVLRIIIFYDLIPPAQLGGYGNDSLCGICFQ